MDEFLIILLLVIFFLLISLKKSVSNKFKTLQDKIDVLTADLKKARPVSQQSEIKKSVLEDDAVQRAFTKPAPVVSPPPAKKAPDEQEEEIKKKEETVVIPQVISAPSSHGPLRSPAQAPKPKKPGFFERNPDLEKFIGENLTKLESEYWSLGSDSLSNML